LDFEREVKETSPHLTPPHLNSYKKFQNGTTNTYSVTLTIKELQIEDLGQTNRLVVNNEEGSSEFEVRLELVTCFACLTRPYPFTSLNKSLIREFIEQGLKRC
jgi:hypothetical protein